MGRYLGILFLLLLKSLNGQINRKFIVLLSVDNGIENNLEEQVRRTIDTFLRDNSYGSSVVLEAELITWNSTAARDNG
jgi:hypothetical protein